MAEGLSITQRAYFSDQTIKFDMDSALENLSGKPSDLRTQLPQTLGVTKTQHANAFTETLEFPLNVASTDLAIGNHGHYIMFMINEQDRAQLRMSGRDSGGSVADDTKRKYAIPQFIRRYKSLSGQHENESFARGNQDFINDNDDPDVGRTFEGPTNQFGVPQQIRTIDNGLRSEGSTIKVTRKPTHRLKTTIAMYMPSSVQVTYGAQYSDTPIGTVTEGALSAYNKFVNEGGREGIRELKQVGAGVANSLQQLMLGTIGALPGLQGTKEAFEMKTANVIADRLELAFKGINKRNFQYTFKMIPKDRKETEMIRKIIFAFKANMLPEFRGGNRGGRRFLVPNTFDIKYMYGANQNLHLHNISTCVLENMSVSYGGERYKTFSPDPGGEGAQPVETSITLNFKEIELITRERVMEGF